MDRFVCVHGHFYQPPRENPWLDAIEVEDSAAPYHDWNERVAAECYGPNAASRLLDANGFIERVVNNYARISFNFGPTLLGWIEEHAPDLYGAILEGDRESRQRFSGHGSALAQAHSHMIMPLANERDKRTQVVWGIRDFEHRFGRRPEGMWLPETAVDTETLEALAEQGIAFTILAPNQAKRVRWPDAPEWQDVDEGSLDTTRAYCARLPSGRSISLFFYNGSLSHAVAFERLLADGAEFGRRLIEATAGDADAPRLCHVSTDGESYGHHHRFGDMGLAFALERIDADPDVRLTNYGEFLARYPAVAEVEIAEPTAWSCAHGVERWRSDCGCNMGLHPDWNQAWRAPLREALDWLRDRLVSCFESESEGFLRDPWAARDDYIELVLDRTPERSKAFVAERSVRPPGRAGLTKALKLLEMQRQAMLMFASCAWFFDDVAGIETIQAMMHAGCAIQLAQQLGHDFEEGFLEHLASARSNVPRDSDGASIYKRHVMPAEVDLQKLAGHFAVCTVFRDYEDQTTVGIHRVERLDHRFVESGKSVLALGRVRVTSSVTEESAVFCYAVLHLGDQNLTGGVSPSEDDGHYRAIAAEAEQTFARGDFPELVRFIHTSFREPLSLRSLFKDDQRQITRLILDPVLEEAEEAYRNLYEEHISLIRFLVSMGVPLPHRLGMAGEIALNIELERALAWLDVDRERVASLLEAARLADIRLDSTRLALEMQQTLQRLTEAFAAAPSDANALATLENAVLLLPDLPFEVDIWRAQNLFYLTVRNSAFAAGASLEIKRRLRALGEALRVRVKL